MYSMYCILKFFHFVYTINHIMSLPKGNSNKPSALLNLTKLNNLTNDDKENKNKLKLPNCKCRNINTISKSFFFFD